MTVVARTPAHDRIACMSCPSDICSSADLAAELNESVHTISDLIYSVPALRDKTQIVGGRRIVPRTLLPDIRLALAARREGRKMITHPLSAWTGNPTEGEFTPRHLALATEYMRKHVGCTWDQAAQFARANHGKEPGSNEPLTAAQAAAVMHALADRPSLTLDNAIHFVRRAGTDTERGIGGGNSEPDAKLINAYPPPIYETRATPTTSGQREADARRDAARQDRLRRAWEELSAATREMGIDPERASRLMQFLNVSGGDDWKHALDALDATSEMSREQMDRALKLMRDEPKTTWSQAFNKIMGRYPD
jgi:hypothetical protein